MKNRILIAEDETRIVSFLEKGLKSHGFTTVQVATARDAIEMARGEDFDLLLLDLGLRDHDGFEVIETLRGQGETIPIIILSARDDLKDKVMGLEGGANDYITKPFRFEELLVRIKVQLRNVPSSTTAKESQLQQGGVTLDLLSREVFVNGDLVTLSSREFMLAEVFFRHPGQVMSRTQLLNHVWGYDYDAGSNIVDVYVGYLRKKLGGDLIETVRGSGYRLRIGL